MQSVFVTVGSTQFDELTQLVTTEATLQALARLGCRRLTVQYGTAKAPRVPPVAKRAGVEVETYDYKASIANDLAAADVVIGHAGAGTILEALGAGKKMVVVVNDRLMSNHQTELAFKMKALNHLDACTCDTLLHTLAGLPARSFARYHGGEDDRAVLNHIAGVLEARRADALRSAQGRGRPSIALFLVAAVLAFALAHTLFFLT
ncbi:glycosyltransferase 28 domain containing 1 [Salpingoeca rosetta]|uniref:UDP-N-acetylglucosamine transferase subunit ALG13 n=1 Tax=Salpingoeca rosetta (strain ATCC 50818 / BSB-021) TaxID=946362 RepID=F2U2Q9_SALR5|nr:glycosyltransferase 28 domain containing 1 [Salpingoeca rosetta]EGD81903.1 glycosyltransferase 28 domain containing 1 [Salpingoeca rosetta]|eukprot:XP_004996086.1 glycosyltransferase 28 domain containing 1 [Salpingoeca rosetta]